MRIVNSSRFIVTMAAFTAAAVWYLSPATLAQGARERTLFVSAVDKAGKPVEGLGPEAFIVREDGRQREILRVSRATEPIDIAVLVDNSTAAGDEIMFMRTALSAFVTKMAEGNHIAVVTLADRPTIRVDYSSDAARLADATGGLFAAPQSGMTLLDALSEVSQGLRRRETPRAVIVAVVTDGTEFTNTYSQDVLRKLKEAKAALHAVTIGMFPYSDERATRERVLLLNAGPKESGGQRITLLSPIGLAPALDRLAAELKAQYKVVYARPQSLIVPDAVSVSAAKTDLVVRGAPARGENGE
jgi:VWFA-related protein